MASPAGCITDVAGLAVGHFTDPRRPTGCTVVLALEGAVGGVDVRGAAPGTRETDLLSPLNTIASVHAVPPCSWMHCWPTKRIDWPSCSLACAIARCRAAGGSFILRLAK